MGCYCHTLCDEGTAATPLPRLLCCPSPPPSEMVPSPGLCRPLEASIWGRPRRPSHKPLRTAFGLSRKMPGFPTLSGLRVPRTPGLRPGPGQWESKLLLPLVGSASAGLSWPRETLGKGQAPRVRAARGLRLTGSPHELTSHGTGAEEGSLQGPRDL